MAEESFQEKTEKPTLKRLEKAKQEGNVAKSTEVPSALILLTAVGMFALMGSWMFWTMSDFMRQVFEVSGTLRIDQSSLQPFTISVFKEVFVLLVPIMMALVVAGVFGNVIQIGFLLTSKPFAPKFSHLDPIKGMKKIASLKSLVELLKAVFKCVFVAGIAFFVLHKELDKFPSLIQMEVPGILSFIGNLAMRICVYVCIALIVLAVLDYTYQRWQHRKNLRMTKQEIRDESKQSEGDPKVKGKIRQIQMETARRRMMEQVPNADVIITNPTHLAIALKYKHEKMAAPQVVAKGADLIAKRIREIAEQHGIPIVENKPLAQKLFKTVDLGDYIPVNLYKAVAEILAYVYRLKQKQNRL